MNTKTFFGILIVLTACFFWGLIFVIPHYMEGFSCIEIALGRYFFYGLIAASLMAIQGRSFFKGITKRMWLTAVLFALVVNIIYFTSLVLGVRYANASITALLSGLGPITIAYYSNWKEKTGSYQSLTYPSLALLIGLILVNIPAFDGTLEHAIEEYLLGLVFALLSLGAWTWFVVSNARFLKQYPELTPSRWANIMGVVTLGWVLLIGTGLALTLATEEDLLRYTTVSDELTAYLIGTALLGLTCSWLGFYLWYKACTLLPTCLAGQLAIFETIFGLIFVFFIESRTPSLFEFLGIVVMLGGIIASVRMLSSEERSTESVEV